MKRANERSARTAAAYLAALIQLALLGLLFSRATQAPPDFVGELLRQVPRAAAALSFREAGFVAGGDRYHSVLAAQPQQLPTRTVEAAVPVQASGEFRVGSLSATDRVKFKLPNASSTSQGRLEGGAVIHEGVYADVDLISVRDPERFEIAFVLRTLSQPPELAFEVQPTVANAKLRREPDTGALLVENAKGQPLVRVPRPVAFDAAG